MKNKKKYEKPKILEITKIEAIAGICTGQANCKNPGQPTCTGVLSS